jgi:DNA-binding response OmpR family regulator
MEAAHRILIVSSANGVGEPMLKQLAFYETFAIDHAGSAEEARRKLAARRFAAMLVDASALASATAGFCAEARRSATDMPIVVLGPDDEQGMIASLDAGAIDYVATPVRAHVLLARLRAHVRQYERSQGADIALPGGLVLLVREKQLLAPASGCHIPLTNREIDLLRYLHGAPDRVVSQRQILVEVWGYGAGADTHTIQTHVYRLRRKLAAWPGAAKLIVTDGHGYRLARAPDAWSSAA